MSGAIGIIGVGHLARFLVEGLKRNNRDLDIILSPRNPEIAADLAGRFGVRIADDNDQVVALSSTVVLSTRPDQAAVAVRDLPWRQNQTLISVAAGIPLADLRDLAAPAQVVRAMPISCAAINESPTSIYPDDLNARALFSRLGVVLAFADEQSFEAASVLGAVYGWVYALVGETARWTRDAGVPEDEARALVALTVRGAAGMIVDRPDTPIAEMLDSLATPGGITRHGLDLLEDRGALSAWAEACQSVLERLRRTGAEDET